MTNQTDRLEEIEVRRTALGAAGILPREDIDWLIEAVRLRDRAIEESARTCGPDCPCDPKPGESCEPSCAMRWRDHLREHPEEVKTDG
jgi:hypothetical protein